MSRLSKGIILGLLTGIKGLILGLMPFGLDLEENIGLDILFKLRGTNQAPSDVVIINADRVSADYLNLPHDLRKWPRSLHGKLTEKLTEKGAAVIAFDLSFLDPTSPEEDNVFATAVKNARNVVFCKCLKREKIPRTLKEKVFPEDLNIVSLVPPIPPLSESAIALAPFPLPRVPVKLNEYWTFKTAAGDTPTLPVVVFQIFAMEAYGEFIHLLKEVNPDKAEILPHTKDEIINSSKHFRVDAYGGCESCHATSELKWIRFDHRRTKFALTDKHARTACAACHSTRDVNGRILSVRYGGTPTRCIDCHRSTDARSISGS